MNERRRPEHELLDGKLEALLRTLPEEEPPADLTRRIMAQVLAAEEAPVQQGAQVQTRAQKQSQQPSRQRAPQALPQRPQALASPEPLTPQPQPLALPQPLTPRQPLPPWQLGLALTAAAAVALFVVVSSWPAPAELILSVGATLARAAGSALDWLHTGVRLLGTLLDNVDGALAAIWTVVRAGTRAAAAAAGPLILPAAGATVPLQLLLWAMLRTRRDPA